ncbi:MAG: YqeG family HAD IIIA-type phosphatase [Clostridiales bacterium]|nr:YqeG family HAD IIIA-type phosphatase [Clostridiales bacterium]
MGRGWKPDFEARSLYHVDLEALRQRGVKGLILDLDNTLVHWNAPPDDRTRLFVEEARRQGFRLAVVSNNRVGRVAAFCRELGIQGVSMANKPRRRGFRQALRLLALKPEEAAVIGDQIWTDVWGGNRTGCVTVRVQPLGRREFIGTRLARAVEWVYLWFLRRTQRPALLERPEGLER